MKKYIKPLLEVLKISDCAQLMENTNQTPWVDAKENNMFLFDDEEFDDENDLWGEKPNADKYDLWND
jgi:hypothetical protein